SRRRHTRCLSDWSSDVCSSDLSMSFSDLRSSLYQQTPVLTSLLLSRCRDAACLPSAYELMLHSKGMLAAALRPGASLTRLGRDRSEERRVGKEGRWGWGGWECR